MENTAILAPVATMFILTLSVWLHMYIQRISYMAKHDINSQDLRTPAGRESLLPETINYASYNLHNLLELPVIFYVLCLTLYVTNSVDGFYMTAAWIFVVFRILHSVVHCTFNRVILRFGLYMVSAISLWVMALRFALGLLG